MVGRIRIGVRVGIINTIPYKIEVRGRVRQRRGWHIKNFDVELGRDAPGTVRGRDSVGLCSTEDLKEGVQIKNIQKAQDVRESNNYKKIIVVTA